MIAIIGIWRRCCSRCLRGRESRRARRSAWRTVKNIAIAINMYLTDYDRFPPETDGSAATSYFHDGRTPGGCDGPCNDHQTCAQVGQALLCEPLPARAR